MVFGTTHKFALGLGVILFASLTNATTYAVFCADNYCKTNCGGALSVDNPGCLNLEGRNSVKFHGENPQQVSLVFSPAKNCNCQNYCISGVLHQNSPSVYYGPPCADIGYLNKPAKSYRFIGGGCGKNNC